MTDDRQVPAEELLDFPCDYIFKTFGPAGEVFVDQVRKAVDRTISVGSDAMKVRASSGGKYVCVSVVVRLENFSQLVAIYTDLRKIEGLVYLL